AFQEKPSKELLPPTQVYVWSYPNFSAPAGRPFRCNLLPAMVAQVGSQGNVGNQNGNVVNDNVQENIGNVLMNGNWVENVQDMSDFSVDQKVKYTSGSFVGKALMWWNSQIYTLSREVAVSMSWNDFKFMIIEEFCPSHEMQKLEIELWNHAMVRAGNASYTDRFHELARNGSIKKVEKGGNVGEPSKDKNGRDDNKRTRTGNDFAITTNPVGTENVGAWPKCATCNSYHAPGGPCRICFNCNRPGHLSKDGRGVPRNVNPVNARNQPVRACYKCGSTDHVRSAYPGWNMAQGPRGNRLNQVVAYNEGQGRGNKENQARGNRLNQVVAYNEGQGRGNKENQARGKAFILGAKEAPQDPNIVTGIEPSKLGFRIEIEIANEQLVKIDKVQKKNDVKARSVLLMELPNEHLRTFNQYKDAKTLFAAIQTRFGSNEATKKTLLKQMYENFSAPSTEFLESIFNRLQKIVSQLAILDTMSFDDLYNNFKIVEQEVKGTISSSSSLSSQNMAFVPSPSSTNEVNTAYGVSTANPQVSPASTQLALLSMRTRKFFKKTGRKITINGNDTVGYDKSKVECFNCHKLGHFSREYRQLRNQDSRNMNQDSSRRTVDVEETSSKALVAIYGAGFE
nr:reverse transcriptase domain-containing protein [Tanacetum cinerariifolium]